MVFSLLANAGTVGKSAVPPKSPANFNFPFTVEVASGVALALICASTYVLTAFCVGNNTSLVPKVVIFDLFTEFSLAFKAV